MPPQSAFGSPEASGAKAWIRASLYPLGVWGAIFALAALGSLAIPQRYQSVAVIDVSSSTPLKTEEKRRLESNLTSYAQDAKALSVLAAREDRDPAKVESLRASIQVRSLTPSTYEIEYRSHSAELAQKGCGDIVQAIISRGGELLEGAPSAGGDAARAELDRATKALTDFVVAHPDAPVETSKGSSDAPRHVPNSDPAIGLLRQEKARIEAELVATEPSKSDGVHENPYADPADKAEADTLKLRLAEIRNAIVAHQRAIAAHSSPPAADSKQFDEWRRLARAVADAQRAAFAPKEEKSSPFTVKVVQAASLPAGPLEPIRKLIVIAGMLFGFMLAAGWTIARFLRSRAVRRSTRPPVITSSAPPKGLTPSGAAGLEPDWRSHGSSSPPGRAVVQSDPPNAELPDGGRAAHRPSKSAQIEEGNVPIPPAPAVPTFGPGRTQIGMIDPAAFAAQTAPTAPRPRVESRPILDVTATKTTKTVDAGKREGHQSSSPPRPSSSPPLAPRPRQSSSSPPAIARNPQPSRGVSTNANASHGAPSADERPPITKRIGSPFDEAGGSQTPPANGGSPTSQRSSTSYKFVDPGARASAKRRSSTLPASDAPDARRVSETPGFAGTGLQSKSDGPVPQRSTSERPPAMEEHDRRGPSAMATSPAGTRPGWKQPTPPGLVLHRGTRAISSRPPSPSDGDMIAPRSVPPSWEPGAVLADDGLTEELSALRDQLLDACAERCFVVGVTSEPAFGAGKSHTAAKLATMLAQDGRARVLLMEADFEYPTVQKLLAIEMPHSSGFSQQMRARLRSSHRQPWVVVRCSPTLDVLGESVMRSPGLLFSQGFAEAVTELRQCYDVIVADGPVIGVGADHKPLDATTDGLVFVIRAGAPLGEALDRATRYFKRKEFIAAVSSEQQR